MKVSPVTGQSTIPRGVRGDAVSNGREDCFTMIIPLPGRPARSGGSEMNDWSDKMTRELVYGPTYGEMLHPETIDPATRSRALEALETDPMDPVNLYNITWKNSENRVYHVVLPGEITGIAAPIVLIYSRNFPTGSHKVGATYSVCMERQLQGEIVPGEHTVIWPSTGNYGIGGAWAGTRMGYDSLVLLPEMMSRERFEKISSYGARFIKTPGCESNVKEIYDKANELAKEPRHRVLNQFAEFANYRFHYHVTGNSVAELLQLLASEEGYSGKAAAFVSAMGSAGTIAAGDRLKQLHPGSMIIGVEPVQCPTLYNNGYGGHDIQGIGDKHVTWIHNVKNMDAICCIDDMDCKKQLQVFTDPAGMETLATRYGIPEKTVEQLSGILGISGICNILASIKTAKFYGFGKDDMIVTVATDAIDRYHSVMADLDERFGSLDTIEAAIRYESILLGMKTDWFREGTKLARDSWFNLKYYTWVEQQGKTVEELNAQLDPEYWIKQQEKVSEITGQQRKARSGA